MAEKRPIVAAGGVSATLLACLQNINSWGNALMSKPQLTFWFDFGSTYSFLAAMRIEQLAKDAGVEVTWKPFLLGPVFQSQGLKDSPLNVFPVKGKALIRDAQRIAEDMGIPFKWPEKFPQSSVLAGRVALVGLKEGWGKDFGRDVFAAEYSYGRDISDPNTITEILAKHKVPVEATLAKAQSDEIKSELRDNTADAQKRGFFGAPTFTTASGELFWGNDRLEQALRWAKK